MWVTAVGAWGDTLAAIGTAKVRMAERGIGRCDVIHYGFDRHIAEFLRHQPCFERVVQVRPEDRMDYSEMLRRCSDPELPPECWLPEMLAGTGIYPGEVERTHTLFIEHPAPVCRWHDARLPARSVAWASSFLRARGVERFYLLHPQSEQSTPASEHWPHWRQAVEWLLEETDATFVWTGQGYEPWARHPRIVNVVGLTPSMMEVYALAGLSEGIVSTSNSLSMWSVITGKPALVAHNKSMDRDNFFKRWVTCKPNTIVEYRAPLQSWIAEAEMFMFPALSQSLPWPRPAPSALSVAGLAPA